MNIHTEVQKQRFIASPSLPKAAGVITLLFTTFTLALFFVVTGAGVWYFWKLFQNDAYKLVASFLLLILVANTICKYALWYWRQYGRASVE